MKIHLESDTVLCANERLNLQSYPLYFSYSHVFDGLYRTATEGTFLKGVCTIKVLCINFPFVLF